VRRQVVAANAGPDASDPLPLKGFAVGDACAGTEVLCGSHTGEGPWWRVVFFYGHGQFSTKLFNALVGECTVAGLQTGVGLSDACAALLAQMDDEIGGYYDYNLYDDCIYEDDIRRRQLSLANSSSSSSSSSPFSTPSSSSVATNAGGALNDYVCGGGDAQALWANAPAVRTALHVPADAYFFSGDNGHRARLIGRPLQCGCVLLILWRVARCCFRTLCRCALFVVYFRAILNAFEIDGSSSLLQPWRFLVLLAYSCLAL
jgi:hypothetical protein